MRKISIVLLLSLSLVGCGNISNTLTETESSELKAVDNMVISVLDDSDEVEDVLNPNIEYTVLSSEIFADNSATYYSYIILDIASQERYNLVLTENMSYLLDDDWKILVEGDVFVIENNLPVLKN